MIFSPDFSNEAYHKSGFIYLKQASSHHLLCNGELPNAHRGETRKTIYI